MNMIPARPTSQVAAFNVTAVVRSDETRRAVTAALGPNSGSRLETRLGTLKALRNQLETGDTPGIFLFDVDVDDAQDLEAMDHLRRDVLPKGSIVIATAEKLTTLAVRRMLRDGVEDFLPQPLSSADLLETVQSAARKMQESERASQDLGRVFTFMKAAGGMGATTLAVHTACALARPRRKLAPARVCLIDLDVQFGGVALGLDLEANATLADISRAPERLDADLLHGSMARYKDRFDVLTAPPVPMPLDALRSEAVGRLVDIAQREYDFVVVDLPRALTQWTDAALTRSASVFIVTQQTVPAILQTCRLLELIEAEGHYALPLALVLNRYRRQWSRAVRLRQAEKALGRPFDFVVDDDEATVTGALNQGMPVFETRRRSRFARTLEAMADKTAGKTVDAKAAGKGPTLTIKS